MNIFCTIFLYFFIYSILGWIVETIYCRVLDGKWSYRGFLFGPYCPIYGFGSLLIIYFLQYFIDSPVKVFFLGMLFTSTLEYISSYLMEKLFHAKWWDYSKYKINLNGRICLLNSIEFAILGLLLTYLIHPVIFKYVALIPTNILQFVSLGIMGIMGIDCCFTVATLINLKEKLTILDGIAQKIKEDAHHKITDSEVYKQMAEIRNKIASTGSSQIRRIMNAFPDFEFIEFKKTFDDFKLELEKIKKDLKEKKIAQKLIKLQEKRKNKEETK